MKILSGKNVIHLVSCLALLLAACKKDKPSSTREPVVVPKRVTYEVTGTHFKLNFIDSMMAFKENQLFNNSFVYQFSKPAGTNIGMSIYKQSAADTIFSWRLLINGKLYANGFSEGGVYMMIPY